MEARIETLTKKLVDRIRPFVDAHKPGDPNDPETIAFEKRMKLEADDLKLESFGVEVIPLSYIRHTKSQPFHIAFADDRNSLHYEGNLIHQV